MSIGEAEDYRFYWQNTWKNNKPDWLLTENPQWKEPKLQSEVLGKKLAKYSLW